MVAQNLSTSSSLNAELFSMVATPPRLGELSMQSMTGLLAMGTRDHDMETRTTMHCKYPSKKCWNTRVEKRNGELHKFCEYHRQKANSNQRRMEQRRKQLRTTPGGEPPLPQQMQMQMQMQGQEVLPPVLMVTTSGDYSRKAAASAAPFAVSSPCGVDQEVTFPSMGEKHDMCMDVPFTPSEMVAFEIAQDAALDCMMLDNDIEMEPSDRPVDLYEADLFFLEHFMSEITHDSL